MSIASAKTAFSYLVPEAAPYVDLDEHYTLVHDFDTRFPAGGALAEAGHIAADHWRLDVRCRRDGAGRCVTGGARGHHRIADGTTLSSSDLE